VNLLALWRAHGLDEALAQAWANVDVAPLDSADTPGGRGEPVDELHELRLRRAVRGRARQRGARG
jgi:hypothetical protein